MWLFAQDPAPTSINYWVVGLIGALITALMSGQGSAIHNLLTLLGLYKPVTPVVPANQTTVASSPTGQVILPKIGSPLPAEVPTVANMQVKVTTSFNEDPKVDVVRSLVPLLPTIGPMILAETEEAKKFRASLVNTILSFQALNNAPIIPTI